MKRILNLFALVVMIAMGAASCQEVDDALNDVAYAGDSVITLTVASPTSDTRISFEDNDSEGIVLEWEVGDSFSIYDSEGSYVGDFVCIKPNDDGVTYNFQMAIVDGVEYAEGDYTAIYPASTEATLEGAKARDLVSVQDGDAIANLDAACYMLDEFTYTEGETTQIIFEHQMAIMTFKFLSEDNTPAKLVFENGEQLYTINYTEAAEAVDGLYTSHIMIEPCDEGERTLHFSLYDADSDLPYDERVVTSSKAYQAGMRYTASVSNYDEVMVSTETGAYEISTPEGLRAFAKLVNSGVTSASCILTADIDLGGLDAEGNGIEGKEFTPIGSYVSISDNVPYRGIFNGNGHTISGLYINSESDYQALFGYISYATISDLHVIGNITGANYVAGIVGSTYYDITSTIRSCSFDGSVTATGYASAGIAADISSSTTITDCYNTATINGKSYSGGIVGTASGGTITGCYNTGEITAETYAGGIAAYVNNPLVYNCYNTAAISGSSYAGGIVGFVQVSGSNTYFIGGCYNIGSVTGGGITGSAGGVIGLLASGVSMTACYNTGSVSNAGNCGGIAGHNYGTIDISYYASSSCSKGVGSSPTSASSATMSLSEADMTTEDFVVKLNNAAYQYNSDNSDAYQIYGWKSVAESYPEFDFSAYPSYTEIVTELVYNEDSGYYEISSASALKDFADLVNSGESTINGMLTDNIALNNVEFTPIGSVDEKYFGMFDGADFSITGLYINSTESYQALFGYVEGATIENITVSGSVTGATYVAGIAAYAGTGSTITNCHSNVSVTGAATLTTSGVYAAGVVGYLTKGAISDCSNSGAISGYGSNIGGVAGYLYSSSAGNCSNTGAISFNGQYAGGVIGYLYASTLTRSYNEGEIATSSSSASYVYMGGVVGNCRYTSKITHCYNSGEITASALYTGGVVGYNYSDTKVISCYNLAPIAGGRNYVAGVVGYNYNSTMLCYNAGAISGTNTYCGGVLGSHQGSSTYNYYLDTTYSKGIGTSSTSATGVVIRITEDELKSEDLLITLNNAAYDYNLENPDDKIYAWKAGDNGYPTFDFDNYPSYTEVSSAELTYDAANDCYNIASADDLRIFSDLVKYGQTSINGCLTADIDLESVEFTPIGSTDAIYKGNFDGGHHSITGLYINTTSNYQGFIGYAVGSTIKDLGVSGSVTGGSYVGGLLGYASGVTVSNCNVKVDVVSTGYVGGVTGYIAASTFDNCHHEGSVAASASSYSYCGGLIGYILSASSIYNCSHTGSVYGYDYTGGLVGRTSSTSIVNSYNEGDVKTDSRQYVGGLTGYSSGSAATPCAMVNCYNIGSVGGSSYVGGLVGDAYNYVESTACYNVGSVTTTATNLYGSIMGRIYNSTSSATATYNNYDLCTAAFYGSSSAGTIEATNLYTDEMQAESFVATLNSAAATYNSENPDAQQACTWVYNEGGYPKLNLSEIATSTDALE